MFIATTDLISMAAQSGTPLCQAPSVRLLEIVSLPAPGLSRLVREVGLGCALKSSTGEAFSEASQVHIRARDSTCEKSRARIETQKAFSLTRRDLVAVWVATVFPMYGLPPASSGASLDRNEDVETPKLEESQFGFDGLGKDQSAYVPGKIVALAQAGEGAVLFLGVEGFEFPLRMVVGAAEALAVLTAAQDRKTQRPVTHEAWSSTLAAVGWKVDRVMITALEQDMFYSRLVISLDAATSSGFGLSLKLDDYPESLRLRSIDMRPSDGIALALRCRAPLFIYKQLVEEVLGHSSRHEPGTDPLTRPGIQAIWKNKMPVQSVSSVPTRAEFSNMLFFEDDE